MFHEGGRGLVGAIVVWLVWDQPYGPFMPLICVAGLVGSRALLAALELELFDRPSLYKRLAFAGCRAPSVSSSPCSSRSSARDEGWRSR